MGSSAPIQIRCHVGATFFGLLCPALLAATFVFTPAVVTAQGDRSLPSQTYYNAAHRIYEGEYRDAVRDLTRETRGGYRSTEGVWLDAICTRAMLGEAYFHLGNYDDALASFNSAIEVFLAHSGWLVQVQFPSAIGPDTALMRQATPWGQSASGVPLVRLPHNMLVMQGKLITENDLRRGGVIRQARQYSVDVVEVIRCTALAIRRRHEIMGPLSEHAHDAESLLSKLRSRPGPPNHWSSCWIDLQLGLAQIAGGRPEQAKPNLTRAMVLGGQYHHPLTAVAMVELGRLALEAGDLPTAAKLAQEALYPAYYYEDLGALEDALRLGFQVHIISNRDTVYPALAAGLPWARRERLSQLEAWLVLMIAENQVALGQATEADSLLRDVIRFVNRPNKRDVAASVVGARASYVSALVACQLQHPKIAAEAIDKALAHARTTSLWNYQIHLADSMYRDGGVTPRQATELYKILLRDPASIDWSRRPYESLAVTATPHSPSFENWFNAANQYKKHEEALEISDAARRHRFFSAIPLGGRLLALRTVLETPAKKLPQTAALQRQDLMARYAVYQQLIDRDEAIRQDVRGEGLLPEDPAAQRQQVPKLNELGQTAAEREVILRQLALRRESADMLFPPRCVYKDLEKGLRKNQALLAFFSSQGALYGYVLSGRDHRYVQWQVRSPAAVRNGLADLLRAFGNVDGNREVNLETLDDTTWKQKSGELWKQLFAGTPIDLTRDIEELIVVPDDFLWYLPFEALVHPDKPEAGPLVSQIRIRYAPTVALAIPNGLPLRPTRTSAVVLGKLYPRDDEEVAQRAFEQLRGSLPGPLALRAPLPAPPQVVGALVDDLIVWNDLPVAPEAPLNWSPIPTSRGRGPGGTLADWMQVPVGGPQRVLLPGFHTPAESALRRRGSPPDGREMFLSVCSLMASGARTVLISRWRTSGQTALALVDQFIRELPHSAPANAWQLSVLLAQTRPLDWEQEPRVRRFNSEKPTLTEHPFFWAGYMLVDDGTAPVKEDAAEDQPAAGPVIELEPRAGVAP